MITWKAMWACLPISDRTEDLNGWAPEGSSGPRKQSGQEHRLWSQVAQVQIQTQLLWAVWVLYRCVTNSPQTWQLTKINYLIGFVGLDLPGWVLWLSSSHKVTFKVCRTRCCRNLRAPLGMICTQTYSQHCWQFLAPHELLTRGCPQFPEASPDSSSQPRSWLPQNKGPERS